MHIEKEPNSFRYVFKFPTHAHHSFWCDGNTLKSGTEVEVHTIEGPERFQILVDW